jgi:hypothetical protein
MKTFAIAAALAASTTVSAVTPVTVKGNGVLLSSLVQL